MYKNLLCLLALLGALWLSQTEIKAQPFAYQTSDVMLGFRKAGATYDLELDLGSVMNFINATPGSVTTFSMFTPSQLTAIFGSQLESIQFSATACTRTNGGPTGFTRFTMWITAPRLDPAVQTTPWNRASSSIQGNSTAKIDNIGVGANTYSSTTLGGITSANNTANLVRVSDGDPGSYNSWMGVSGDLGGTFQQGSIEQITPTSFASGSAVVRSDFYQLVPGSGSGVYLGYFEFSPTGTLTFTAAGGVTLPTLSTSGNSVTESGTATTLNFTVTLSTASASNVSVNYQTSDGTAIAGTDYTATSGTLQITAGNTQGTISVPILANSKYGANKTFNLTLSSPVNATLATSTPVTGTVMNGNPAPTITVDDLTVTDGDVNSTANFTVSLSAASGLPVTFNYATANNTAVVSSDYLAASGTITIPAGNTSATIPVTVVGQSTYQPTKTFYVNLSNASGGTLARTQITGTILDNHLPAITQISSIAKINGENVIQLNTTNGLQYTLYYTNSAGLTAPLSQWGVAAPVVSTGGILSFTNSTADSTRFYLIGVSRVAN